jgi:carbamate kinase
MDFPAGSMGPKVDAVCRFVELTGDLGAIGRLEDAPAMLRGEAGTVVTPSGEYHGPPRRTSAAGGKHDAYGSPVAGPSPE